MFEHLPELGHKIKPGFARVLSSSRLYIPDKCCPCVCVLCLLVLSNLTCFVFLEEVKVKCYPAFREEHGKVLWSLLEYLKTHWTRLLCCVALELMEESRKQEGLCEDLLLILNVSWWWSLWQRTRAKSNLYQAINNPQTKIWEHITHVNQDCFGESTTGLLWNSSNESRETTVFKIGRLNALLCKVIRGQTVAVNSSLHTDFSGFWIRSIKWAGIVLCQCLLTA